MNIDQKLQSLRNVMKQHNVDAYIIPSGDPHQSEYPADHWKSREWISGFDGSAGTVAVTMNHAGLWTDSRYFLQAEEQLKDSSFELHKMFNQFSPGYTTWLAQNLNDGDKVAIDGALFSLGEKKKFEKILLPKGISLEITNDLISSVWSDRPEIPLKEVFEHDVSFAGQSRTEKLNAVRKVMKEKGASLHLISTLDDIGWLFNLRGYDVEFNPVFVAYTVVTRDGACLFVDSRKLSTDLISTLNNDGIELKPYEAILDYLSSLGSNDRILIHEGSINLDLYKSLQSANKISGSLVSRHLKAIKNSTEINHFRSVMVKDGVALTKAFKWLEETLPHKTVSEFEFSNKLAECRSAQSDYYGESFAAIIGYNGNGAIIHYRPEEGKCAQIQNNGILLADSGGQYYDGTTDITRTIALSEPTGEQKDNYTRVLKGHIALAKAKFPVGTTGGQLDILARKSLWDEGLNYLHGTGHGVGFFMNVHEPPQGFAPDTSMRSSTVHEPGMVSSNEPGFYKENEFGIRIENLVVASEADDDGFMEFETITLFPIDTQLINLDLLDDGEKTWLNDYHADVYAKLSSHLESDEQQWLKNKCAAV